MDVFGLRVETGDIISIIAVVVSIVSFVFSLKSYKVRQKAGRSEVLVEISSNLNSARWHLRSIITKLQLSNDSKTLSKTIDELNRDLKEIESHFSIIRDAIDTDMNIEHEKLAILRAYSKNSATNYKHFAEIERELLLKLDEETSKKDSH